MFLLPAAVVLAVPRQLQPGPDVAVPRQLQPGQDAAVPRQQSGQDAFVSGAQLVCPEIKIKFYETIMSNSNKAIYKNICFKRAKQ